MPAEMKILGWKAAGLRCPDHEINCCNSHGAPHRVSLIQMPNGTGKTTTLSLLRAALSGSALNWDREKIRQYQKKRNGDTQGRFELRLLLNTERVTIIMNFDFDNGRIYYKTTRRSGQGDGFNPPGEFRRFLNDNFVNFFVFNGELAEDLLDRSKTNAEAVVESLFQINAFTALQGRVEDYWQSRTENVTATEERGLTRRQNRLSKLNTRLDYLEEAKQQVAQEKAELATRLNEQQGNYAQEISKEEARAEALNKAQIMVKEAESKVRIDALDVLDAMRDPHALSSAFATAISELKAGLDRVKLPESAAREFFEELANEAECVCGREIDPATREMIRQRATQYLGSEDVSLLNSMKTNIQEALGSSVDEPTKILDGKIEELEESVEQQRSAREQLYDLRHEAEQLDPAVKQAREEIERLHARLSRVDGEMEKFDKDDDKGDDTFNIQVVKSKIQEAEDDLAEITQTIEIKAKRDILKAILTDAHAKARSGITQELCAEANRRILELMPYNNISISGIERSLVLDGQEGGSQGETLSVAYAFLATLFNRSEHRLPFVVDSPAGAIDLAVRPKIGELIPKLADQFIAFTISSERNRFVQPLKRAANNAVQFITLFRKGSAELEEAAHATHDYVETSDGITAGGEAFFDGFQLDKEEVL